MSQDSNCPSAKSPEDLRFYKGLCAPFAHEPTMDRMEVVSSTTRGEGVIARAPFKAGEIVFKFFGPKLPHQTLFTLQETPGVYVEDPFVMGKILHSCDPNMICDMTTWTFTAVRDIQPGEFLSMDYETTEDELFQTFNCLCGTAKCRGRIAGRAFQTKNTAVA